MAIDQLELQRQQMQEAAANAERGRKQNIEIFTRLFLSLGADCVKVASSNFDGELAEARSLASYRWNRLLDLEAQCQREEATLAGRPKKRPTVPSDDAVPDRTLEKWNAAWEQETASMAENLKQLKQQAKDERKALEALRVDYRRK